MSTKKIVKKRKYGYRLHIYGILGTPTTSTGRRRNHSLERENHNGCIFWQQKNNSINTTLRFFNVTMWFFSMVFSIDSIFETKFCHQYQILLQIVSHGIGNKHEMIFSDASQIAPFLILVTFGSDRDLRRI